jgi:Tfp pilus assembly protein PilO
MKDKSMNPVLLGVLGLLVVAGGWFMLIRPQGERLGEVRGARAALEDRLELVRQEAATPTTTGSSGEPTPAELAVPHTAELPTLLRQLDGIARETGMVHASVSPSAGAASAAVPGSSVQLTINAAGSQAGAYAYLNRLALLPRLVVVEQVSLDHGTGPEPTPGSAGVNLQLLARVFTTAASATTSAS